MTRHVVATILTAGALSLAIPATAHANTCVGWIDENGEEQAYCVEVGDVDVRLPWLGQVVNDPRELLPV